MSSVLMLSLVRLSMKKLSPMLLIWSKLFRHLRKTMKHNSLLSSAVSLLSTIVLARVIDSLLKQQEQERESSRRQQTELLNRLASTNWGSILTNSEPQSAGEFNPVADPNEYEPEPDPDEVISYIDFDDLDKFGLPKL